MVDASLSQKMSPIVIKNTPAGLPDSTKQETGPFTGTEQRQMRGHTGVLAIRQCLVVKHKAVAFNDAVEILQAELHAYLITNAQTMEGGGALQMRCKRHTLNWRPLSSHSVTKPCNGP